MRTGLFFSLTLASLLTLGVGCLSREASKDSAVDGFNADTGGDSDTDVPADTGSPEDTGEPEEPQTGIEMSWTEEGLSITITNPTMASYQLGLVDTLNGDGWRGEDCLDGMAGHLHCHPLGPTGGTLLTVFDVNLVEAGVSTRHTRAEGAEGALSYALLGPDGTCLAAFGHLPDYYISSALSCPAAAGD
jgi:hypothetical protein